MCIIGPINYWSPVIPYTLPFDEKNSVYNLDTRTRCFRKNVREARGEKVESHGLDQDRRDM